MDGLTQAESRELEQRLQKRQVKEFMGMFSNMVDGCFAPCIDDFTSKALSGRETGCLTRCVQKSMAATARLSERFQENNAAMTAQMEQGR
jgi:import inner membrane translocase subunit TIM9